MEEEKFKPCNKCKHCDYYCRGGYEYYSDRECYVEEGCNYDLVPNEDCEYYMPTAEAYIDELEEEIKTLKKLLLDIYRESKSNGGKIGEHSLKRLDDIIKKGLY